MLTRFVVHVIALLIVFYFFWHIQGSILWAAILMALILAAINLIVRPVLLILTLPVTILTLGLFVLILNALLFGLAFAVLQGLMNVRFEISLGRIVVGYILYVIISTVLTHLLRGNR